jgi:hypothetical protein
VSGATQVEPGVGGAQQVDLLGWCDPEVADLGEDALAGRRLEATERAECPLAQQCPGGVGVDDPGDPGVVVVAGEDALVGAPVVGLALADQQHRAACLGQTPGARAAQHAASHHGDRIGRFSHLDRDGLPGPRRTCSRPEMRVPS